jgi:hypothetical protein
MPFFSRILSSIVVVRQPEQKITRKTGTKVASMSRFPNLVAGGAARVEADGLENCKCGHTHWPHVHAKRLKFLGNKECIESSSS